MDSKLTRLIAVASSSVLVLTILAAAPAAVRATTQIYIGDGTGSGECGTPDYLTDGSADEVEFNTAVDAEDGDIDNILYVCPGTYDIENEITVDGDLTIESVAGAASTILDADGGNRILRIFGDAIVRGLTFKDGQALGASDGGAIYSEESDLTVEDSVFINNSADDGGAINHDNYSEEVLVVRRSVFSENLSRDDGGAIFVEEDLDLVIDSEFLDNVSQDEGGAIRADEDLRDWDEDGESGIIGSTFSGNRSEDSGGALYLDDDIESDSLITGNTFSDNAANTDNGFEGSGGGIHIDEDVFGSITENTFTNNTAVNGGGLSINESLDGTVSLNKFIGNAAEEDGGGLWVEILTHDSVVTRNQFRGNTAAEDGGGAWFNDGYFETLSHLAIVNGNVFRGNRAEANGGALFLDWRETDVVPASMTRNSFRSNRAGGMGGAIAILGLKDCSPALATRQAARAFKKNKFASNRATESRRTKNVGAVPCEAVL